METYKGVKIMISGTITPQIMKCQACARELKKDFPDSVADYNMNTLFPAQWDQYLKDL